MKIKKILATLLASALLLTSFTACGGSDDETTADGKPAKVVIGTQQMPNDEGIAKALNYFEEEMGVEVEIQSFDSGADVNTALASGDIDFGLYGSCPVAIAISNDIGVEFIWIHEVLGSVESLVAREETGITKIEDLVGKKVATPFASTAHFSILKALENAGIADKVDLVSMTTAEIVAAWELGQIDAAYIWEPTLSQLDNKVTIITSEDCAKAGYMTSNIEVVRKEFAEKYPEIVAGYIKAVSKAVDLYKNDQSTAVTAISKFMDLSEDDALFQMSGSTWLTASEQLGADYLGTSDAKGAIVDNLYETALFLKDQGSLTSVPDKSVFEAAVNPKYIEMSLN